MICITDKKDCCGCGACSNVCLKKCIRMEYDDEGFLYPIIDKEKCIDCGLCEKVCPIINTNDKNINNIDVYGCTNKNQTILKESTSGGFFTELAKYVIKQNGVVFGVRFDENLNVIHTYIENENDIKYLRGSKYVQSNTKNSFKEVKQFLEEKKLVLYSGTPCQIAGLKCFLHKDYSNLITCDTVCQGVPSTKIFKAYTNHYEKKYNSKIVNFKFRDKQKGWINYNLLFEFANGKKKSILSHFSPYISSFYNLHNIRKSCYYCKFRDLNSGSDFKMADFWKVSNNHKSNYNYFGVSHILVTSNKAKQIFEKLKNKFNWFDSSYEEIIKLNETFTSIPKPLEEHEKLMNEIKTLNDEEIFRVINKKYRKTLKQKIRLFIHINGARIKYSIKK